MAIEEQVEQGSKSCNVMQLIHMRWDSGILSKTTSKRLKRGNGNQTTIQVDTFQVGNVYVANGN